MSRSQNPRGAGAQRGTAVYLGVVLFAILALRPTGPLAAQYFGQNRVQYRTFDFKVIQTEHFDVYFYEEEREAALDAARMAERSYARLSRLLNHRFIERKPIILYDVASVGAQAYMSVARELMERTRQEAAEPAGAAAT